ncbi:mitochondrial carrier domain-containing protein [Zychaea mexicana]|uniref:mitochondrial carrier domain-containing protein n=1 Tax=Zychaea mexicana TaxID=64656 RepID=UPI0022FF0D3D|nr:mitochondrial carrier domain-containing protein [Zychaea mexicana]KAI9495161.1 mitochondrial carrier domain-containing protein [Zychaea mexicana]
MVCASFSRVNGLLTMPTRSVPEFRKARQQREPQVGNRGKGERFKSNQNFNDQATLSEKAWLHIYFLVTFRGTQNHLFFFLTPHQTFFFLSFSFRVRANPAMSTEQAIPEQKVAVEAPKASTTAATSSTASSVKSFLAGGFGGMAAVLVGQPFDLVKVRLQTSEGIYKNTFDCFKQIIKGDGVLGLYRGMATPLASITPIFAVSFFSYDLGKKMALAARRDGDSSRPMTLAETTFAGAFSAVPTTLVMAPSERIKVLMQIQGQGGEQKYKGPMDAVRQLYKEGGIRSIFRGTGATLLRDSPGSAAYFVAYELIKKSMTPKDGGDLQFGAVLFAGGMAGVAMWSIAIPPDVIKSRIQSAPAGTYTGMMDCLQKTVKADGASALFRGLGPAMLRAFPANAATFLGVEYSRKVLDAMF